MKPVSNVLNNATAKIAASFVLSCWTASVLRASDVETRLIDAPTSVYERVAGIEAPEGCPFEKSRVFAGIGFTKRHAEYTGADTWYPSWAKDGKLYSPWTDGTVNGVRCSSAGDHAATGHATILGDDPLHLRVVQEGTFKSSPRPYASRYPCGSLVVDGVWYYGTYCLHPRGTVERDGINYDWPWLGPFVGFRWSTDFGKSWHETPCTPAKPLFGEQALQGESVRLAVPHFVDFGCEMQHSPDGKAYLVVQGSSDGVNRRYGYNSWITSDQAFLIRVKPSIENMNKASEYEFFAGHDTSGKPLWTRDMKQMKPLLDWRDHMGRVSMTYNPALRKYFMCVTDGRTTAANFTTYLLESDEMTGPWRLAAYLPDFGPQGYFVNIPSKFISSDGTTMWLCYSANYRKDYRQIKRTFPYHSGYAMCLREFKLLKADETAGLLSQATARNLVNEAQVTASSVFNGYSVEGLRDGVVGGYPGDITTEWASKYESTTAMVRLDWDSPRTVARIQLFDRPTELAQMTGGLLVFSDGTTIRVGALPDDARKGLEIRFPPKRVKWLLLAIDAVKPGTTNVGISEMAVFAR